MADIDFHFRAFGDLKQQYLELDLRAVRPLIMVLKGFWSTYEQSEVESTEIFQVF